MLQMHGLSNAPPLSNNRCNKVFSFNRHWQILCWRPQFTYCWNNRAGGTKLGQAATKTEDMLLPEEKPPLLLPSVCLTFTILDTDLSVLELLMKEQGELIVLSVLTATSNGEVSRTCSQRTLICLRTRMCGVWNFVCVFECLESLFICGVLR